MRSLFLKSKKLNQVGCRMGQFLLTDGGNWGLEMLIFLIASHGELWNSGDQNSGHLGPRPPSHCKKNLVETFLEAKSSTKMSVELQNMPVSGAAPVCYVLHCAYTLQFSGSLQAEHFHLSTADPVHAGHLSSISVPLDMYEMLKCHFTDDSEHLL